MGMGCAAVSGHQRPDGQLKFTTVEPHGEPPAPGLPGAAGRGVDQTSPRSIFRIEKH